MKYILIFLLVIFGSAAIINASDKSQMPVGISDVKPGSLGVIRPEGGIGDMSIKDSVRSYHYSTEITEKHPNRDQADFPHFGNN